jgi:hypothetical protein
MNDRSWYGLKMDSCYLVTTIFQANFKLNKSMTPIIAEDAIVIKDDPYKSIVGILMHVMVCTRLDLAYSISHVSQFMNIVAPWPFQHMFVN